MCMCVYVCRDRSFLRSVHGAMLQCPLSTEAGFPPPSYSHFNSPSPLSRTEDVDVLGGLIQLPVSGSTEVEELKKSKKNVDGHRGGI